MKKITLLFLLFVTSWQINAQTIVIGTGTGTTAGTGSDPVDGYFEAFRYQVVYTAAELSANLTAFDEITALGFSVDEDYAGGALAGYTIKMGHTAATNSASHDVNATNVVKNAFAYDPTVTAVGVFDMIAFDTPFIWNGVDNVVIEICSDGPNAYLSPYGGVRTTTGITNGSRRFRTDGATACATVTANANSNRPNIQFNYVDGTPPSCLAPSAGAAVITSATTADLTWTSGGSANAEIVVQLAGTGVPAAADGTGVNVAGVSYSATGLLGQTAYEFYVRDECTLGSSFSTWAGPFAFNTTQAPNCATNISPVDGAVNVTVGAVTFSWGAPASGDAPASYDLYYGLTPGNATILVGNYTTTTTPVTITGFNTTFYWKIVPKNVGGAATGCSEWSFTTQSAPGYCLSASNGQWPATAYTPVTCDGLVVNVVTTAAWAGEYSVVNVTSGETYKFQSSVATDLITISADSGVTAAAYGITPLTWVSTVTGPVRFYTHVDSQCTEEQVNRTRSVVCGVASCTPPTVTFNKSSLCPTASFNVTVDVTNLGDATSLSITDDQASPVQNVTATGIITFGPYANGTNVIITVTHDQNAVCSLVSTALTQAACPPSNDVCASAAVLTPAADFASGVQAGTIFGAITTAGVAPSCQASFGSDVWYTVVVPASGNVTIETQQAATNFMTDSVVAAYSGVCGALVEVGCDDDAGTGNMSLLVLTGQTPGSTLYVGVWKYATAASTATNSEFQVAAYDASLATNTFDSANFSYYPNPVKNTLNLSYTQNISDVAVYNLLGQQVLAKAINASQSQIDMSNLSSGAYMVKVTADNQVKMIKVIKE